MTLVRDSLFAAFILVENGIIFSPFLIARRRARRRKDMNP